MSATERDRLEALVRGLIVDRLGLSLPESRLSSDQALFGGELGLDSIDGLELAVGLEKRFGVSLKSATEAESALASVNAIVDFLLRKGVTP